MSVGNSRNGMALNKSSHSMQPWLAADDDKIKFSEFDRGGGSRYPLLNAAGVRTARTAPGNPEPDGIDFNHLGNPPSLGPPCTRLQVRASLHVRGSGRW
jgi:hypothetical protein